MLLSKTKITELKKLKTFENAEINEIFTYSGKFPWKMEQET